MNETNGYVKLYRKLIRWGWYKDHVVKDLFIHCLCRANFSDQPFQGMIIKRGQFVTSSKNLAEELGFTRQQIKTAIKKLKSTNEITTKSTNRFTVITVVNWEKYQGDKKTVTNKTTHTATNEQPASNQQITNKQPQYKNIKNDKNEKKVVEDSKPSSATAAISFYQTNIEPVTDFHKNRIEQWLKKVDISLVLYAMEQAVSYGALKWSYVEKVLAGQFAKGHTTREQAENQTAYESKEDTPTPQAETPIQTEFKYGRTY